MKVLTLFSSIAVLLAGCSTTDKGTESDNIGGRNGIAVEQWENFSHANALKPLSDKRYSRAVFVRDASYTSGPAVNVYINGEYMTSLLKTGISSLELCSDDFTIVASNTDVNKRYLDKVKRGQHYTIPANSTSYFYLVKGTPGYPRFELITEKEFKKLDVNKQSHTLPRVDSYRQCKQEQ